jgi:hypothetical protein
MRVLHFFVISLALMLPIDYLLAQDHDGINLVGEMYDWSLSGVHDLEIRGDYAFVADGTSAFQVLYIGDSDEFKIAGQISDIGGAPVAVAIQDTLAFLAVENQGLTIIDISDPPDPQIISFINRPGPIIDVAVNDQYVYLLGTYLSVIAIDNPSRPGVLGSIHIYHGREVLIEGNFAYVANDTRDLYIIDISDPSNPSIVRELEFESTITGISIRDQFLYCSDRSRLSVIDISDPFEAHIVSQTNSFWMLNVCVNEQYAFCVGRRGLRIFNIENPEELFEVSYNNFFSAELEPHFADNILYVPMGRDGINTYNVEDVESPIEINPEVNQHSIEKAEFNGNLIYALDSYKMLKILDFTNPDRMVEIGSLSIEGGLLNLSLNGNYAYISTERRGLIIVDISQPRMPQEVARINSAAPVLDVMFRGEDAYFLTGYEFEWDSVALKRVNVSVPSNPRDLFSITNWYCLEAPALRTQGSNIFVALDEVSFGDHHCSGVQIFDAQVDSLTFIRIEDGITDIDIFGNILAVAKESGHIRLFDISDLGDVRPLSTFSASRSPISDIHLTARYIYLAATGDGIKIYDISDPFRPHRVGYYDTKGLASSLDIFDRFIVVGDINALGLYDCNDCTEVSQPGSSSPAEFEILQTFPNPFNNYLSANIRLPFASPVKIDVYDMQGKLVKNLLNESFLSGGYHQLIWNAIGLTSGTYFLNIQVSEFTQTKSVELLK